MGYKTLKEPSSFLLAELNNRDKQFFTLPEATELLSGSNAVAVRKLLSQMVERSLLMRIKDGLYHIIPYDKDPQTYQPDWHITATHLVKSDYYIGYYSALSVHSLITQPALKEQVVVNKIHQKQNIFVKNTEYQIIFHNKTHFFGAKNTWIDNYTKVQCSDLEKTFIDCLFMPQYAGGISEITKAIHKAREKTDYEKLLQYCRQFKSQAVIRRLGFLLELLEIKTPVIDELLYGLSDSYILLDPSLPKEGRMYSRWKIRQNIDTETLKSALSY